MGNWNVSVRGVGPHHNNQPYDVERVTEKFMAELRALGHNVTGGEVHIGGVIELAPNLQPMPPLAEPPSK